jgi:hypothetical protein
MDRAFRVVRVDRLFCNDFDDPRNHTKPYETNGSGPLH